MRSYAALSPIDQIPQPPDSVETLTVAAGAAAAADWAGSTVNARDAGAHLVRFAGMTTLGVALNFMVNLVSSHATVPAAGTSLTTGTTAGSTGNNLSVIGERTLQIPAWSTGFSVASHLAGDILAELWRK